MQGLLGHLSQLVSVSCKTRVRRRGTDYVDASTLVAAQIRTRPKSDYSDGFAADRTDVESRRGPVFTPKDFSTSAARR